MNNAERFEPVLEELRTLLLDLADLAEHVVLVRSSGRGAQALIASPWPIGNMLLHIHDIRV